MTWESTGEVRIPNPGEWFLSHDPHAWPGARHVTQAPSWDRKCCHPRVIMRPVNSDSWLSAMQAKQIEVRPRILMRDLEEWIKSL
jgi:hypothetical protein